MSTIEEQQTSTPIVSDIENAKQSDIESSAPSAPVVAEDEQLQRKKGEDTNPIADADVDVDSSVPVTNGSGSQTTTKKDEQPLVSNGSGSQTTTKTDEQPLVSNGDDGSTKEAATDIESTENKHTEIVNGNSNGDGEHLLKSPAKEEKTNGHDHIDRTQTKRDIEHVNNDETSATTGEIKKKAKLVAAEEEGNDTPKEELSAA